MERRLMQATPDHSGAAPRELDLIRERRSVRRFTSDPVPADLVLDLVRHAAMAPSACNRQAARFVVVTDPAMQRRLVAAGGSVLIEKAPCGILVTYSNTTRNTEYRDDVQSASAAIQNLLLAAHAHGLGACWLCTLPSQRWLRKAFHIPRHYSAVAYIILGYPAQSRPKDVPRLHSAEDIMGLGTFPTAFAEESCSRLGLWLQRLLIWVYRRLPVFVKRRVANRMVDRHLTKKFEN